MERLIEHRSLNQFAEMEARAETDGDVIKITGYGAVFNRFYEVYGFREQVAPGAFTKTLKEHPDIRGMFNHDPSFLLGRTKAGTMEVGTDDKGLWYRIAADALDPQALSVSRKIARKDVDGSSMAFWVHKQEWKDEKGKPMERTLTEVELIETGPVTMPASPTTTAKIQRALTETGIDYDAITGIVIKKRAGFDPTGQDQALIEKAIEILSTLRSEPDRVVPDHSDKGTLLVARTATSEAAWRLQRALADSRFIH